MKKDESSYKGLIEISKQYRKALKSLNYQTINFMQSDEMREALKTISRIIDQIHPQIETTAFSLSHIIKETIPQYNNINVAIADSLHDFASRYKELFNTYKGTDLTVNMRLELERSQLSSIAQLCYCHETPMIHDAIGCFANAQYEYLPGIFNKALAGTTIGAADIAFIKTGTIIPIIDSELVYPRGFKTALKKLDKYTARDLSDNSNIEYDLKENQFKSPESNVNSKGMSVICAGLEIFGSDDLFTEVELMDFVSFLSRTPMNAGFTETGQKINEWLKELYEHHINIISFDQDIYYHCRARNIDAQPYTFDEMLKAPYGIPGAGRFNQVGRAHYYFADSKQGAEAEVKRHLRKDEVLQTVKLKPKREIQLLDLSGTLQRGASFLKMIRYPLKDITNQMPREYLLPCFVAGCCEVIGIEGIKYYGSKEYSNYVSWEDGFFKDAGMC